MYTPPKSTSREKFLRGKFCEPTPKKQNNSIYTLELGHIAREDEPEDMFEIDILEPGEEELVFIKDLSDIESDESDNEID